MAACRCRESRSAGRNTLWRSLARLVRQVPPAQQDKLGPSDEGHWRAKGRAVLLLESQSNGPAFRPRFVCGRRKTAGFFACYLPPPGEHGTDTCLRAQPFRESAIDLGAAEDRCAAIDRNCP